MISSVLIIVFSVALLAYWFRYSCILLLRDQAEAISGAPIRADARFHVLEVKARIDEGQDLDPLHAALERDYRVLNYLLHHAAGLELSSFEDRLLVVDYQVMQWWYRMVRTAAPDKAREALSEMAQVLSILAGKIGERAAAGAEA